MTDRQLKLQKIINDINENYGFGNGYVDDNTDVNKFISEFKYKFTKKYNLSHILNVLTESNSKSYVDQFDAI